MSAGKVFKIDRSQRVHSHGVVLRVYQVFGESVMGGTRTSRTRRLMKPSMSRKASRRTPPMPRCVPPVTDVPKPATRGAC